MGSLRNLLFHVVGVSPKYTNDLEQEYGICKQAPYFEISENMLQINKSAELFSFCFAIFWGPTTYYLDGNVISL